MKSFREDASKAPKTLAIGTDRSTLRLIFYKTNNSSFHIMLENTKKSLFFQNAGYKIGIFLQKMLLSFVSFGQYFSGGKFFPKLDFEV